MLGLKPTASYHLAIIYTVPLSVVGSYVDVGCV